MACFLLAADRNYRHVQRQCSGLGRSVLRTVAARDVAVINVATPALEQLQAFHARLRAAGIAKGGGSNNVRAAAAAQQRQAHRGCCGAARRRRAATSRTSATHAANHFQMTVRAQSAVGWKNCGDHLSCLHWLCLRCLKPDLASGKRLPSTLNTGTRTSLARCTMPSPRPSGTSPSTTTPTG